MPLINNLIINFLVATAYIAGGVIGDLLAVEPSNSSPVWPSSGIALAVMLIYGWRVLPGLFVGIFCTQVYVSFGFSFINALEASLVLTTIKAFASAAQASLGMFLIQRFVGRQDPLLDWSKISLFFFYGGLVSCTVAPSICISVFYLQNIITLDDFLFAWLTWWVGDVIGVIIFTPILLALFAEKKSLWQPRRYTVTVPLCFLLIVIVFIFFQAKQQEADRINLLFNH